MNSSSGAIICTFIFSNYFQSETFLKPSRGRMFASWIRVNTMIHVSGFLDASGEMEVQDTRKSFFTRIAPARLIFFSNTPDLHQYLYLASCNQQLRSTNGFPWK